MARIVVPALMDLSVKGGFLGNLSFLRDVLRSSGHHLTVLGMGDPDNSLRSDVEVLTTRYDTVSIARAAFTAAARILHLRPDVVVLPQAGAPFSALLALASRAAGAKLVYLIVDEPIATLFNIYGSARTARLAAAWLKLTLPVVNRLSAVSLVISPGVERIFRNRGWRKPMLPIYNIHNAIKPSSSSDDAPFRQGDWAQSLIVVYQGAFQAGFRGIEQILQAIALARAQRDVRFVGIGYGDPRWLKDYASSLGITEVVRTLPPQSPTTLINWISQADIAVAYDLEYGLTSKTFEYIAAGLHVFAADYARDVIDVCGDFVTVFGSSPEDLARTLVTFRGSNHERSPEELIDELRATTEHSIRYAVEKAV